MKASGTPRSGLSFRDDGTFTIVQFTDLHWSGDPSNDPRTRRMMEEILASEKPDLVVVSGDTAYSERNAEHYAQALSPLMAGSTPWALLFGNHDDEIGVPRERLLEKLKSSPSFMNRPDIDAISGDGNWCFLVRSRTKASPPWRLYLVDTDLFRSNPHVPGSEYFARHRVDWFLKTSSELDSAEGPAASLVFMHVPFPEYAEVWDYERCYGEKNEECCVHAVNSGFFGALLDAGGVEAVSVGHDHMNDYWGVLHGIALMYGRVSGYGGYGQDDFLPGARLFRLAEGGGFESWLHLADGTIVCPQEPHEAENRR